MIWRCSTIVRLGIAMGNAKEELKAVADHVTGSVDEDGLHQAFRTFGLI